MLRLVYREILDVLYAEGGAVKRAALPDLLALPPEEIEKALATCIELGSVEVSNGLVTNPRVTRTLDAVEEVRRSRAQGGWSGGRPKRAISDSAQPLTSIGNLKVSTENLTGIGIGIGKGIEGGRGGARTWLTHFGEAWVERAGGEPPWERLAKELAPVHKRFGEEVLLAGWRRYLAETEPRYLSPSAFARRIGAWVKIPPKPREEIPRPKLPPAIPAVQKRWREACERVEMPIHLKRTWLSPTDARYLGDDGGLTVIVPSKQHADALRRYETRLVEAYNDREFYADAPARGLGSILVVPQQEPELHEGGL